jgi:hypothetical protein
MKTFGDAPIKKEGESAHVGPAFCEPDPTPREETYYYERAFTKTEFAELAHALDIAISTEGRTALLDKVRNEFREMAKLGYGGGA